MAGDGEDGLEEGHDSKRRRPNGPIPRPTEPLSVGVAKMVMSAHLAPEICASAGFQKFLQDHVGTTFGSSPTQVRERISDLRKELFETPLAELRDRLRVRGLARPRSSRPRRLPRPLSRPWMSIPRAPTPRTSTAFTMRLTTMTMTEKKSFWKKILFVVLITFLTPLLHYSYRISAL
jgi:hypothetical protein